MTKVVRSSSSSSSFRRGARLSSSCTDLGEDPGDDKGARDGDDATMSQYPAADGADPSYEFVVEICGRGSPAAIIFWSFGDLFPPVAVVVIVVGDDFRSLTIPVLEAVVIFLLLFF